MKANTILQITRVILIVILTSLLFFKNSDAQIVYANQRDHLGFTASFGTRHSKVSSNYDAINNMSVMEEGGSAGLVWGNRAMETKLTIGYYYSSSKVRHTTDLLEIDGSTNFFPVRVITKRMHLVEPYITGGITKSYYKLHGYYTGEHPLGTNHSVGIEPYLGSLDLYLFSIGSGVALNLGSKHQFIQLFADAKYSTPFASNKSTVFEGTHLSNPISLNLGVSFGMNRLR